MPTDQNKAVVKRFFDEMCNGRKLDIASQIFSANHIYHDPSDPEVGRGPEGMKQLLSTYQNAMPDAHWGVREMVTAENDTVVTRWEGRGTQKLDLKGIPATGKTALVQGLWMHRLAGGKIVESWNVWDTLGLLQQLGVVPAMGAAKVTTERKN